MGEESIRSRWEAWEEQNLSPYATLSKNTRGRAREIEPCEIRTCFMRDRDRILHCKAFRRLKHKTQVFLAPLGDHYRTRLTHTLEVSQIARTIARAMGLNEDLTEAIALGHDLGHTPFGHTGEAVLNRLVPGGNLSRLVSCFSLAIQPPFKCLQEYYIIFCKNLSSTIVKYFQMFEKYCPPRRPAMRLRLSRHGVIYYTIFPLKLQGENASFFGKSFDKVNATPGVSGCCV